MASMRQFEHRGNQAKRLLIITDSRGRGVASALHKKPALISTRTAIRAIPGAKLNEIKDRIVLTEVFQQQDLIIVAGGICDFTVKTEHLGLKLLTYPGINIHEVLGQIETLRQNFGSRLIIATIPPAGLIKYYEYKNPGRELPEELESQLKEQQTKLLEDLREINNYIKDSNREANVTNIDLNRMVTSTSIKHTFGQRYRTERFTAKDLYDGVHANQALKDKWHKRIADVAEVTLNQ